MKIFKKNGLPDIIGASMSSHDDFVFVDRQIADTFQSDGHRRAIAVDGLGSSLPQAYELRASDSYMPLEITANLLADGPSVTKQIGPIVGTLAALLFLYDKLSGSLDAVVAESAGYGAGWMIVSRMQDHIVETSDGHIHVLLNRGTDLGLTMISTSDDGDSWSISQLIDDSGKTSTSDIRLLEGTDDLVMTFVTDDEYVAYATMSYDLETGSWAEEDVFLLDHLEYSARSVHPTITVLSNGRILIGYTEQVGEGLRITLSWSDDSGATWDDAVIERPNMTAGSARVLSFDDSAGVILVGSGHVEWITVGEDGNGQVEIIWSDGAVGRFASHFSTTTVGNDGYLVVANETGNLNFLHYDAETGTWSEPLEVDVPLATVSTTQISASDTGEIFIVYDDILTGQLFVIKTADDGLTWQFVESVRTPNFLTAEHAKFETPEHFTGNLIIMQQIELPSDELVEGLYYHIIDTDGVDDPVLIGPDSGSDAYAADSFLF